MWDWAHEDLNKSWPKHKEEDSFFIKEEVKPFCRAQYCLQVHASALPGAVGCAGIGKELGLSADW